ncbi:hypothetical protein HK57_00546 [Aspergillus ustus]|uniref:Zn(2)-C6 fungal-type domain-containing protein n=1 Tax=Aspergillus ustus TaxID=40382 RepID=A0A0C1C3R1_ASPUT|nr:hypothetical protein HK57_00546 [Aspergillus ustus]
MSAAAHHPRPKEACVTCKTRKKKCDKALPSCSYCTGKNLDCRYVAVPRRRAYPSPSTDSSSHTAAADLHGLTSETSGRSVQANRALTESPSSVRPALYRAHLASLEDVYISVQNLIRSTGEFIDDLTSRYFRTFHTHLPIIARTRFQDSFITTGSTPSPDSSVLLLVICLITYIPNADSGPQNGRTPPITRQSLCLATKALLAQVHGSMKPSVPLIQATLLLATYEYASGKPEVALATIATCARMAYAARIHIRLQCTTDATSRLEAEEAWNTWWGISISERAFMCEAGTLDQPLTTSFPSEEARLPVDRVILDRGDFINPDTIPDIPISACPTATNVGGFGRAAQTACLVDRMFKAMPIQEVTTALPLLESVDAKLQSSLGVILNQGLDRSWHYCTALAVTLRSLYTLHNHILHLLCQPISVSSRPLDEWNQSSLAALDTATTMAIDMARWHYTSLPAERPPDISPVHIYVVRAAMEHLRARRRGAAAAAAMRPDAEADSDLPWPETACEDLEMYLQRIEYQWVAA